MSECVCERERAREGGCVLTVAVAYNPCYLKFVPRYLPYLAVFASHHWVTLECLVFFVRRLEKVTSLALAHGKSLQTYVSPEKGKVLLEWNVAQSAILAHIWHEYQIEWSYSSSTTELVNEDSITNESSFWWICVAVIPQKWYIQKFAPSIQGHHTVKQIKTFFSELLSIIVLWFFTNYRVKGISNYSQSSLPSTMLLSTQKY